MTLKSKTDKQLIYCTLQMVSTSNILDALHLTLSLYLYIYIHIYIGLLSFGNRTVGLSDVINYGSKWTQ